ncbi:thioredoxin-like domain-containing protein [uncultured Flavobacterium sp.]|uniref:TlpA family protein disulfide reductase n=1 Tax=uncultured Flavobacterium sp. TaxID=165435 RepID=UPI0030EC09A6|tara:strand:+ start:295022 stop:296425 length:1404 start_codon:yes stop_codon:yes gene_type:complete
MIKKLHLLPSVLALLSLGLFTSCDKKHSDEDFTAYFGGEVLNPQTNYVLFLKDNEVIDTIFLDKKNRFLHKFDSLTPGLYIFKHQPEYQYVYFDKNDSLMVMINSKDFDNSIVFCGRGDEKNNYLMEMYLSNEKDRSNMYDVFFRNSKDFIKNIDSSYALRKKIYEKHKSKNEWSVNFDTLALASLELPHYYKKEVYPYAHKFIAGENVINDLPKDYYNHRKSVDFNNPTFANFYPYVNYVTSLLNNITFTEKKGDIDEFALENNIKKLNIADTLIKNNKIKNHVLNGLALRYLMEEQNMFNNSAFIKRFLELSTDKKMQNEITTIENSINKLAVGNKLTSEKFVNEKNEPIDLSKLITKETVIFFCNTNIQSHLNAVHKKAFTLKQKYPNINFIAINIDDTYEEWGEKLKEFDHKNIIEIHAVNSDAIKEKWAVYKIHRSIILNADGTIKNAFVNLFDVNFEKNLN